MAAVRPIRSKKDLTAALARLEKLWPKNEKFSSQSAQDEFDVLTLVIEDYEKRTCPMPPPTPFEAIRFEMESHDLNITGLAKKMGVTRGRAGEVLSGKRGLSVDMIRRLVANLGMDAGVLVGVKEKIAS